MFTNPNLNQIPKSSRPISKKSAPDRNPAVIATSKPNSHHVATTNLETPAKTNSQKHHRIVIRAGIIAITVNLILTILKIVISALSGSVAILSDALHGLVDTLSGIIVIVAELIKPRAAHFYAKSSRVENAQINSETHSTSQLTSTHANSKATKNRPKLTHADIERVGARIIAIIIILVSVHIFIEAVIALIHPESLDLGVPALVVLIVAMLAKIALALFLQKTGRKVGSATLRASGVESFNDSIVSAAVLLSTFVYFLWQINLEAYISFVIAFIIFKSSLDIIFPHKKRQK